MSSKNLEYDVGNLKDGYAYKFRVKAVNEEGPSEWLETDKSIGFNRPKKVPGPPEGPMKQTLSPENVLRLSWHYPLDDGGLLIDRFNVEMKTSDKDWESIGTCGPNELFLNTPVLNADKIYSFRVNAQNPIGVGQYLYSNPFQIKTHPSIPSTPVGPLTADCVTLNSMTLNWNPSLFGNPTSYCIEYSTDGKNWKYIGRSSGLEPCTYVAKNLKPGNPYWFRVIAENDQGRSSPLTMDEPIYSLNPYRTPSKPNLPITFSDLTDSSVMLSWKNPDDEGDAPISHYSCYAQYKDSPVMHKIGKVPFGQNTICAPNLIQGRVYNFLISATNQYGTGELLKSEDFCLDEPHFTPDAPAWVKVIGKAASSVTIQWVIPNECKHGQKHLHHVDQYIIYQREDKPDSPWVQISNVDHFFDKVTIGNLSPDKKYYFGVAGVNQYGIGDIVSTTEPVSPEAVTS